jgi:hypothetical protein
MFLFSFSCFSKYYHLHCCCCQFLNSSEVRKLCNISNPASDGVEIQEARDQVGAQHLTFAVLAALIGFHVVTVLLLGYQLTGS